MSRHYRFPHVPSDAEDRMTELEHLLVVLRTHQKHKEHILDDIFLARVQLFMEFPDLPPRAVEAGELILQTRPTHPILYIQFFEAVTKSFDTPSKICKDCKVKFYPILKAETRNYCRSCM